VHGPGPVYALLTVVSTLAGGLVALRLHHRLSWVMAFTGGVVIGVALLDILPESIERLPSGTDVGQAVAAGFLLFFILSRVVVLHHRDEPSAAEGHREVGAMGAAALSFHSFIDGFAIGVAFAESSALGFAVLIAVVGHDFADGMNTVTFVLSQHGGSKRARGWLYVDAIAPLIGAVVGSFVLVGEEAFGAGLGVLAGIFLAIGGAELLPEAHSETSAGRIWLTIAGMALPFGVSRLGGL
jgi:zinc transporter, ZIP family